MIISSCYTPVKVSIYLIVISLISYCLNDLRSFAFLTSFTLLGLRTPVHTVVPPQEILVGQSRVYQVSLLSDATNLGSPITPSNIWVMFDTHR